MAKYNENGTIDTEIEHPKYGLIPCTVSKDDPETAELFEQLKDTATPYSPPAKTAEDIKLEFELLVESGLYAKAKELGYDSDVSACSYAGDANPFQEESKQFIRWRGAVWATCYALLDIHTQSGTVPTKEEFLAELPLFEDY